MSRPASTPAPPTLPLVVDLDGTLSRSDTLYETFLLLLKRTPWVVLLVPLWLLRGKAHLKAEIARRVELDAAWLPYQPELLDFLRAEAARGRKLVLATAADRRVADAVARHLGLFSEVYASDGHTNLSGPRKLALLQQALGGPFEYAGNCDDDWVLWREAHGALVVDAGRALRRRCGELGRPVRHFASARRAGKSLLQALRVHQWAKNLLLFVPLLAAHRALETALLARAAVAFLAFSLCASSVYVVNDLLDLESDRRHPTKRRRPFAAGDLPLTWGLALSPLLLAASAALTLALLPAAFGALLAAYFVATLAYSLHIKQLMLADVLMLAGLYTVRLLAGSLAVQVPVSRWLFIFSIFLFLSLALLKRVSEVRRLRLGNEAGAHGRGYVAGDLEQLGSLGTSAGLVSVLVLALYISGDDVRRLYTHPERLWLLVPLMLYWVSRVWLLGHRGEVNEDPLVFALKDRVSYVVGALGAAVLWAAT